MSLTTEDRGGIRDIMRSEIAASEERIYRRIKDNALGEVIERLDGIDGRLDSHDKRFDTIEEILGDMGAAIGGVDSALIAFRAEFNDFRENH